MKQQKRFYSPGYPLTLTRLVAGWLIIAIGISIFRWWQGGNTDSPWYSIFLGVWSGGLALALLTLQCLYERYMQREASSLKNKDDIASEPPPVTKSIVFTRNILFYRAISLAVFLFGLALVFIAILFDLSDNDATAVDNGTLFAAFVPAFISWLVVGSALLFCAPYGGLLKICFTAPLLLLAAVQLFVVFWWLTLGDQTDTSWALLLLPSWIFVFWLFCAGCCKHSCARWNAKAWCAGSNPLFAIYYFTVVLTLLVLLLSVSLTVGDQAPFADLSSEQRIFIGTLPFLLMLGILICLTELVQRVYITRCWRPSPYVGIYHRRSSSSSSLPRNSDHHV